MTCLNPYLTVGQQLTEPLLIHDNISIKGARAKAIRGLEEVGILDAEKRLDQYPHEFSGGMRQRVMIAMALITEPELLIADEPTTALDVTVQAQILDLIQKLQKEKGTAVIFITHDLGVIASLADRVLVMYAGRVVEEGETDTIFYESQHPYTRALLKSIPAIHTQEQELYSIPGLPPDVSKPIPGCAFAPRCELAETSCQQSIPPFNQVAQGHHAACIKSDQLITGASPP